MRTLAGRPGLINCLLAWSSMQDGSARRTEKLISSITPNEFAGCPFCPRSLPNFWHQMVAYSCRCSKWKFRGLRLWLAGKHDVVPVAEDKNLRRTPNNAFQVYHGPHAQPKLPQQQVLNEVER